MQYVNIERCRSTLKRVKHGVPRGSILGPVLFLVFIDNLPKILEHSETDIYAADGTTISASAKYELAPGALSVTLQAIQEDG